MRIAGEKKKKKIEERERERWQNKQTLNLVPSLPARTMRATSALAIWFLTCSPVLVAEILTKGGYVVIRESSSFVMDIQELILWNNTHDKHSNITNNENRHTDIDEMLRLFNQLDVYETALSSMRSPAPTIRTDINSQAV